ncbi:AAA family ATPase [Pseudomonas sp. PB103]|uniref:AAA family ATPase n=1 Tax=Pseudomonas sp. PB103 TaxID=2494698 RepID=UPI002115AB49|nr:AAA family ATPase [Pseudomonas sp. PB103]
MITKIRIRGYRIYKDFLLKPNPGVNILVGDIDAGKSTLMEAISLALNGRIGGRGILEELNPHWFNTDVVTEFLTLRRAGMKPALPQILIELYLQNTDELQGLLGAVNYRSSITPTNGAPSPIANSHGDRGRSVWLPSILARSNAAFVESSMVMNSTAQRSARA